jgi:hypothetical protein
MNSHRSNPSRSNVLSLGTARRVTLFVCTLLTACSQTDDVPARTRHRSSDATGSPVGTVTLLDDFDGRRPFPADNWWNQVISDAPVDAKSTALIDFIGRRQTVHADFGPTPYGIPYVGVSGAHPRTAVTFVEYAAESDAGFPGETGYPIPDGASSRAGYIEGGVPGGGTTGDRHLLLVDRDRWVLYELFGAQWMPAQRRWRAGSGAVFDLSSNLRRPDGWTSADGSGLAILPGLVRYDEAFRGPIRHALRTTVRVSDGYVWPASHSAGTTVGALPMGARLRLKASKDISSHPTYLRNIFRAMQTHGLIVSDNGRDMFVTGTMDSRWESDQINRAFHTLTADDFEVVQLGWR